jgi:predicted transcriptional regulator
MADTALNIATLTAEIVASYVSSNKTDASQVAELIQSVHTALSNAGKPVVEPEADTRVTPAQIRKSITPEALVSFVDGRSYKSLKRHLSSNGMSPDEYRTKFGLPRDYPMVTPAYSAQRSELAKKLGLGRKGSDQAAAPSAPAKRAGRRKAEAESAA